MKKTTVAAFILMVSVPAILGILSSNRITCDVPLLGFTDLVEKPSPSLESVFDGSFQSQFSRYFDQNMKPRGVLTKTYSSIQYHLFNKNNLIIGKNKDLFDDGYISGELCINGYADYSKEENRVLMQEYVNKLELLREKLATINKQLIICVSPSKANFDFENVPQKYKDIANKDRINAVECFAELISKTNIPHLIFREASDTLKYPPFYTTGIHWSRTFEQQADNMLIDILSDVTGKRYRHIALGEVIESDKPFRRDLDFYNLLNVWDAAKGVTYYAYEQSPEETDNYDKLRLLVEGTSFCEGFVLDIADVYPFEDIIYINRKNYIYGMDGSVNPINQFEDLDFEGYLNRVDAVLIESTEHEIGNFSNGFVDYLLAYLDHYTPSQAAYPCVHVLDANSGDAWMSNALKGIYGDGSGSAWTKKQCEIMLDDPEIFSEGLEIEVDIPSYVFFSEPEADQVHVYVNGALVSSEQFETSWQGSIYVEPQLLNAAVENGQAGPVSIQIDCSKAFVPKEIGLNEDVRSLALRLIYVGRKR